MADCKPGTSAQHISVECRSTLITREERVSNPDTSAYLAAQQEVDNACRDSVHHQHCVSEEGRAGMVSDSGTLDVK